MTEMWPKLRHDLGIFQGIVTIAQKTSQIIVNFQIKIRTDHFPNR
jgi:hypothetical protein